MLLPLNAKLIERNLYDNGQCICIYLKYEYKLENKIYYLTIPMIPLKFAGLNYTPHINMEDGVCYNLHPAKEAYGFTIEERRVHYGPRSFKQRSKRVESNYR